MPRPLTLHNRPQKVLDAIATANAALSDDDRQAKYAKLAEESPYRFFRGTNHVYWDDVWHDWRFALFGGLPETQTWLQGDAHAYNFGAYGHHDDAVRYGMDDFDDALVSELPVRSLAPGHAIRSSRPRRRWSYGTDPAHPACGPPITTAVVSCATLNARQHSRKQPDHDGSRFP